MYLVRLMFSLFAVTTTFTIKYLHFKNKAIYTRSTNVYHVWEPIHIPNEDIIHLSENSVIQEVGSGRGVRLSELPLYQYSVSLLSSVVKTIFNLMKIELTARIKLDFTPPVHGHLLQIVIWILLYVENQLFLLFLYWGKFVLNISRK